MAAGSDLQADCRLLRLPVELRLHVYTYIFEGLNHTCFFGLDKSGTSVLVPISANIRSPWRKNINACSILRTNRHIHGEASEHLWDTRRFRIITVARTPIIYGKPCGPKVYDVDLFVSRVRDLKVKIRLRGRSGDTAMELATTLAKRGTPSRTLKLEFDFLPDSPLTKVDGVFRAFSAVRTMKVLSVETYGAHDPTGKFEERESFQMLLAKLQASGVESTCASQPCTFLRLPTELRLRIYAEVFATIKKIFRFSPDENGIVSLNTFRNPHRDSQELACGALAVLRASKQINAEAKGVLWDTLRINMDLAHVKRARRLTDSDSDEQTDDGLAGLDVKQRPDLALILEKAHNLELNLCPTALDDHGVLKDLASRMVARAKPFKKLTLMFTCRLRGRVAARFLLDGHLRTNSDTEVDSVFAALYDVKAVKVLVCSAFDSADGRIFLVFEGKESYQRLLRVLGCRRAPWTGGYSNYVIR